MDAVINYIESNYDRFLGELCEFLRIPSISTDEDKKGELVRAARFLAGQFEKAGVSKVEVIPTDGHPVVYAERVVSSDRPTILIYGHYDVQPVDPIDLWETGPFEPSIRDGKLYARGSTDDKGQLFIHLKSIEAILRVTGDLPVNVKCIIEGEEEIGSPNLEQFITAHLHRLAADAVVISDTAMFAKGVPSICYGLRGLAYLQIDVTGPNRDLHSGSFGGPVANPAFVLAEMLASMKDKEGRITIPGFYDAVVPLTDREREEWRKLPFDRTDYCRSLGVDDLNGESGYSPLEQVWARPTLEVNGVLSGFTGSGAKTVLPSRAMAKVSMRLVPNQDPDRIAELFEAHIARVAPPSVKVQTTRLHGGKAWVASLEHPALVIAAEAIERGFGKRPLFQREGGSIPIVATFSELLGVPAVLMGIGLPDENAHAPNENLDLDNFRRGIKSAAYFLDGFGKPK